jgi:hypothetical protein
MLAWAFDDTEPSLWQPRLGPMPPSLSSALRDPSIQKCAWNFDFEKDITEFKLGIQTKLEEWYDPSVLCAYMSLPIGLDRAGKALETDDKKIHITGDDRPVKLFSQPSKSTKKMLKNGAEPLYFKDWDSHPEKWAEFCAYCIQDVVSERAVHYAAVGLNSPMTPGEKEAWLLDQRMNDAGVWIDQAYVKNAMAMAVAESDAILWELAQQTGLENPNSRNQLLEWLTERGYPFDSLDMAHVEEALALPFLKPLPRKILQLKQKLGGSAYKKLQSITDRVGPDGRLRDQFVYHGAHTGRWSGRGVQLQNLYKSDPSVSKFLDVYTRAIRNGKKIYSKNSPMELVASTIRSAFAAPPGSKLVVGDLAQIESRVLAALAQCQQMIDAYSHGHDLYCEFMTWLLKRPITKKDPERAQGKVVILGCFEENTLVLTDSGWKRILDVEKADLVFDGLNFVAHGGVIAQGKKEVIPVCGVGVTPDHRFLSKGWVEACQLQKSIQLEQQASSLGIGSFLSIDSTRFPLDTCASAKGVTNASLLTKLTWKKGELGHAYPVLTDGFGKNKTGYTSDGHTSPEKSSTDLQTDTTPSSLALDRLSEDTVGSDTLVEELRTDSRVSMTSSGTSRLSTDMNLLAWRLTESIMTDTTNEETSSSLPDEKISKTEVDTFDILNAGTNSRFMILTTSGPMIVHNCGFGMGVEKFIGYAATFGITLNEQQAGEAVYGFREKYKEIPEFWEALNAAAIKAVKLNICVYVNGLVVDGRDERVLKIKLPSGRAIHYHKPCVTKEAPPWGGPARDQVSYTSYDSKGAQIKRLYGGLLTENVVQAIARDLLLAGMIEAEKRGFKIIMTIHDEIAGEVPKDSSLGLEDLLGAMVKVPEWGEGMGFVLAAEGWEGDYYRK